MTFLARDEKILLNYGALGVIDLSHIVDAVAIDADGLVGLLVGMDLREDIDRRAMEVGDIGIEHVRTYPVSLHQFFIGMTFCTELWREEMELAIGWSFDVVHAMAVDAGRDKGIAFADKCGAMHALLVTVVDFRVTLLARMWDLAPGNIWGANVMEAVAVGADRRFSVPCGKGLLMHAIQC